MFHCLAVRHHFVAIAVAFSGPCRGEPLLKVLVSGMALDLGIANAISPPSIYACLKYGPHVPIWGVAPNVWLYWPRAMQSSLDYGLCLCLHSQIVNAHIDWALMKSRTYGSSDFRSA